jgi:hypothetical protein
MLVSERPRSVHLTRKRRDPVIIANVFNDLARDTASIHRLDALRLHARTSNIALLIHDLLKRIVFPAEDVVTVVSVPSVVAKGVDEGLAAVFGPHRRVVEGGGFIDNFVHELWYADWVRSGAGALGFEGARGWVCLVCVS